MLRVTLTSLLARKLRLALSGFAIVLGVTFVAGALVLTDTLGQAFDRLFADVTANTSVTVRADSDSDEPLSQESELGVGDGVSASLLPAISAVKGVALAEPSVNGFAELIDPEGEGIIQEGGAPALGITWTDSDNPLSSVRLVEGHPPDEGTEVAIGVTLAEEAGYSLGDTASVVTLSGRHRVTISGLFELKAGEAGLGGATVVAFPLETAQQWLGQPGRYTSIDVVAAEGLSDESLRDRIADILPPDVEAITGEELADQLASDVQQALSFFNTFLLIFAAIALFVGAFLIFNTFTMLVASRSRELALLRALGASRRQVTGIVLVEAVLVGLVAAVLGLGGGIGLAALLQWVFSQLGIGLPRGSFVVAPRTIVVAVLVGVVVTALAALMPARKASAVPPVAAMRDQAVPDASLRRITLIGGVGFTLGAVVFTYGLLSEETSGLWWLGSGAVLIFLGVAALSPILSGPVTGGLGRLFSGREPGRLGRQNALRNPRRTAATAGALMIGLALVSAISVIGDSAKASVRSTVDQTISADFVLDSQGPGFSHELVRELKEVPQVAEIAALRGDFVEIADERQFVVAAPSDAPGELLNLTPAAGSLDALAPGTVLISEDVADDLGVVTGDTISVTFAHGTERSFKVAGVYGNNALVGGYLFDSTVAEHFATSLDFAALIELDGGVTRAEGREAIATLAAGYANVEVQERSEFIETQASAIDQVIAIIYVLLAMSVIIAVLGIVNTLALSVVERTRELGLLRAIGMSRRQVKRMIRVESVLIAVFGALLGIVVGSGLGVAITRALHSQGLTELSFPLNQLFIFVGLAALAGVAASWFPARRASRLNVLDAIATE